MKGMGMPVGSMRPKQAVVLIVHEDSGVVDLLRGLFEPWAMHIETCADHDSATGRLAAGGIDVVMVPWEGALGRGTYRWIIQHRSELREQVVVLRRDVPEELRGERRRVVALDDLSRLLEITAEIVSARRPRLLLVDDDVDQLAAMTGLLSECGFTVSTASSGTEAIALLGNHEYDVVLSDWQMPEGDGSAIAGWSALTRPEMLRRLVFMTGGDLCSAERQAHGAPVLPKGQDSPELLRILDGALRRPRIATGTPPLGVRARRNTPDPRGD